MKQHRLNVVLCGTGTVGGTLLEQMAQQQKKLREERGLDLRVVGVVDIFNIMLAPEGISLEGFDNNKFREQFKACPKSSLEVIHDEVLKLGLSDMVFVDCTASYEIADLYHDFLSQGISIVCANKVAASGDIEQYKLLKRTALEHDCKYNFETNVGAGLPLIHTIDDLVKSGDRITGIEAVLSGTLNFIFDTISADVKFSDAVRMAKEQRFSEPDPRIDLSGIDVIRKLVILARESGYMLSQDDVEKHLFVPQSYFDGTLDDFWKNLPHLDSDIESIRSEAEKAGQHLRFVAHLDASEAAAPKLSVSLKRIDIHHPFYNLEGSNNIIMLHTERYNPHPMIIQGYGAGAGVTAAGVFADILDIVNV
jgi:aspartokinase/homoserine dehydrogenase 1